MSITRLLALVVLSAGWLGANHSAGVPPKAITPQERLEQSPRHHEWVAMTTRSGRKVRAFLVYPEVETPVPAVVVIHENRGLNEWARSLADQVAETGFVALAPDMLSGKGPNQGGSQQFESADAARSAIYQLSEQEVHDTLDVTIDYARRSKATTDKVAVAGFCWGGGMAFDYATRNRNLAAVFVFYGRSAKEERMKDIQAPVYGFYGGSDFRITGQVPQVEVAMAKFNKTFEPVVYPGAGHAFMRSGEASDADNANRTARNQAWQRWTQLLQSLR
jgi:carboxymethylenebutenolidase